MWVEGRIAVMLKVVEHKVSLSISSNMSICVHKAACVRNTCSEYYLFVTLRKICASTSL